MGGLGGQNTETSLMCCPQLLATAKNCCYNRVGTLLLGGAERCMRISFDPGPNSSSPGYPAPRLRLECLTDHGKQIMSHLSLVALREGNYHTNPPPVV